ncbi:MAG: 1-acyl-sn-glycerol-3-phosphate acyltransferase [Xanthomonadales bacterium]|nr:1-acyl-sn-glycerol-3-phosphate acyltransferase [Gammaproteobacteria bacterium]NNE05708.1 1-acyl-sn-glycerol-3-phosphate acyltransferase [Xanthomonadales bacterium]NNL94759.1 1-acyl-sn-glycerol-3-phosphate acyltransferase [Xanthomonadales bacterium]
MWTDFLTPVRWLLRGVLLALMALLGTPVTVLTINRYGRAVRVAGKTLDEFMLNWWTASVCRIFGIRVDAQGSPLAPPCLVVANHISWLDIIVLHSQAAMGFVSKAEIARWPLIGFLARLSGTLFHQRGDHASSSNVAEIMTARLGEGGRVAVFPEGGIIEGDFIKRFHGRLFRAAIEGGFPVQPVMIRYLRKGRRDPDAGFRKGENFMVNFLRLLGRPQSTCELRFLAPLESAGSQRNELARKSQAAITAAFEAPLA